MIALPGASQSACAVSYTSDRQNTPPALPAFCSKAVRERHSSFQSVYHFLVHCLESTIPLGINRATTCSPTYRLTNLPTNCLREPATPPPSSHPTSKVWTGSSPTLLRHNTLPQPARLGSPGPSRLQPDLLTWFLCGVLLPSPAVQFIPPLARTAWRDVADVGSAKLMIVSKTSSLPFPSSPSRHPPHWLFTVVPTSPRRPD